MKKTFALTTIVLLAGAVASHAQGYVNFACYTGYSGITNGSGIGVFMPQDNNVVLMGNTINDAPVGTLIYGGPGSGTNKYNGIPIGGCNVDTTYEGFYGNGNHWSVAIYAVAGTNDTNDLLAAEIGNSPTTTALFEASATSTKAPFPEDFIGFTNESGAGNTFAGDYNIGHNNILKKNNTGIFSVAGASPSTGVTIQLQVWLNGDGTNSYSYNTSPISGLSSYETIDAPSATQSYLTAPTLADYDHTPGYGQITSFSLVYLRHPTFSASVKSGTNLVMTVSYNAAYGGAAYNVMTSTNVTAPLSTWTMAQSGTLPGSLSTFGTVTITNGLATSGNQQYFTFVMPNQISYP